MSLQDEDGNFLKIVLDIIALPWPTLDSAIYNLFQKSPFSWSSFEDVAALYQRFERYDIRSACTFLRRILPDYAWTHPQMALKFALERGSMKDVAFAAIRNFSLVLADTSGNAFWECVSKTRARLQNTEEKEAREWQAEAHFLFVRCIYAASPQLFQHPQSSVDDWKYVAQDFLEELDQLEAWQVAQRLARRVHQEDSAIIYVGPQPLAGGDPQETLVDEQAQSQESVFSQAYFNRYFLPTQAELMTYTNPLTIIPSDSFMTGLNFYRDRDSAFQQPGVSATSAPDAHPNSFVFVMSSEGILFEAPASQISTAR
ncbi:hypothetical protein QFC19_004175 [Naganishia cerealis]|uniref:Uncharacterized protein n=1 Tax=Naganishia cerealis TaxID=610337 RepID=A0ACC2VZ17_9TREE|nr:hypothetical protein QFC19_004175 [Naganishia cerealis]